jgi:hypothetical protein
VCGDVSNWVVLDGMLLFLFSSVVVVSFASDLLGCFVTGLSSVERDPYSDVAEFCGDKGYALRLCCLCCGRFRSLVYLWAGSRESVVRVSYSWMFSFLSGTPLRRGCDGERRLVVRSS